MRLRGDFDCQNATPWYVRCMFQGRVQQGGAGRLLEDAIRQGVRYRRPVYDSLYLTLAAARGGRVVTADGRLYRGVHGGPLDHLVVWVADPL